MTNSGDFVGHWEDDDEGAAAGPRAGQHPTHNASGLMPAQDDAILDDVAPERTAQTDAFGQTLDER